MCAPASRIMSADSEWMDNSSQKAFVVFNPIAGYDPNAAVEFWQRMSQNAGTKPPEFLSTHPSDENRIRKIKSEIPEAMKYYKK